MDELIPVPTSHDVSSTVIYRQPDGQNFVCHNYDVLTRALAHSLLTSDYNHHLFIDWTRSSAHPLIFDIDLHNPHGVNTRDLLIRYFDHVFLPVLQKYVGFSALDILLAMRRQRRSGMHIHLLNVQISHDDYVHLCSLMQPDCHRQEADCNIHLDCPSSMCLVASDKQNAQGGLYLPVCLFRIEFEHALGGAPWKQRKVTTCNLPSSDNVFLFDRLTRERMLEMAHQMMPFPQQHEQILRVSFPTRIVAREGASEEGVARFTSCLNQREYVLLKELPLTPGPVSFCYSFLKQNARFIKPFVSPRNRVLKTWYKRFSPRIDKGNIFRPIDQKLTRMCPHLKDVSSPLCCILESYELCLPVYFALCNLKQNKYYSDTIADRLSSLVPLFSTRVKPPLPESNRLTFDTIVYCAFKTTPRETKEDLILLHIGMGWDWILEATQKLSEMKEHVRWIQKNFFPIVKGKMISIPSKSDQFYSWDPLVDRWFKVENKKHIETVIQFINCSMKYFEGFFKSPIKLHIELQNESEWISSLVEDIWAELKESEAISFNILSRMNETWMENYGANVPEYYFFKKNQEEDLAKSLQRMKLE